MNRNSLVKINGIEAGILIELNRNNYSFTYLDEYLTNTKYPALSLSLPKRKEPYYSKFLFPFFDSLLSEGSNLSLQSKLLKIDKQDRFGLLLKTAYANTVGNVTIHEF